MRQSTKASGPAILMATGAAYATIPLYVSLLDRQGVGAWAQLTARLTLSVVLFVPLLWVFSRDSLGISSRRNWALAVLNGLLMLVGFGTYIFSITMGTPPQKAVLLMYLYPIYVALGASLLLGEHLTRRKLICMALAVIGLGLVLQVWDIQGLGDFEPGDLLAAFNGLIAAALVLAGRWSGVRESTKPITLTFWSLVFALAWLIILGLVVLAWLGPDALLAQAPGSISPQALVYMVGLALSGTVLPYALMYVGLERTEAGAGSLAMLSEPVCVFAFSFFFLGQPIGWWQIIGGGLILSAGALVAQ